MPQFENKSSETKLGGYVGITCPAPYPDFCILMGRFLTTNALSEKQRIPRRTRDQTPPVFRSHHTHPMLSAIRRSDAKETRNSAVSEEDGGREVLLAGECRLLCAA
jgi:hypothetical protein